MKYAKTCDMSKRKRILHLLLDFTQQINIDGQCEGILLKYAYEKISDCAGCSAASRRVCILVAACAKDVEHIVGEVRSRANRAR